MILSESNDISFELAVTLEITRYSLVSAKLAGILNFKESISSGVGINTVPSSKTISSLYKPTTPCLSRDSLIPKSKNP